MICKTAVTSAWPRFGQILMMSFLMLALAIPALATPIESLEPAPATYEIQARVRNGGTGFEAVLFTPGDPAPGTAATQLNPAGAPVWNAGGNKYGDIHTFLLTYEAATGTATWRIDFNRDGDYLDAEESATSTSPSLTNKGFRYVNIWGQGKSVSQRAELLNFTINGQNLGSFVSKDNKPFSKLYTDSSGLFADLNITAQFFFAGGTNQELPRIWVQLGAPEELKTAMVPLPGGALLFSVGLAVLLLSGRRHKVGSC